MSNLHDVHELKFLDLCLECRDRSSHLTRSVCRCQHVACQLTNYLACAFVSCSKASMSENLEWAAWAFCSIAASRIASVAKFSTSLSDADWFGSYYSSARAIASSNEPSS